MFSRSPREFEKMGIMKAAHYNDEECVFLNSVGTRYCSVPITIVDDLIWEFTKKQIQPMPKRISHFHRSFLEFSNISNEKIFFTFFAIWFEKRRQ